MNVKSYAISELHLDPANARAHSPRNIDAIKASLARFGQQKPVVIDSDKVVRAGNGTLMAAKELGWDSIDAVVSDLTDAELVAYGIADNRTAELAEWNADALRALAESAQAEGIELECMGFTAQELPAILGSDYGGNPIEDPGPGPVATGVEPHTQLGDTWRLGDHFLHCGDARHVDASWAHGFVLMVTDPPYGVDYASKNAYLNAVDGGSRIERDIEGDADADAITLWHQALDHCAQLAAPGACYYATGPSTDLLVPFIGALNDTGWRFRHMLVWVKNNHVLGRSDYNYKHEPIFYGWREDAPHFYGGSHSETSVWEIDRPMKADVHPTMKPVELYVRAMRNSSRVGDKVYDPFCGSGTALLAAEESGRCCVAVEIDPLYVDVAVRRWQKATGKQAVHAVTGDPFPNEEG